MEVKRKVKGAARKGSERPKEEEEEEEERKKEKGKERKRKEEQGMWNKNYEWTELVLAKSGQEGKKRLMIKRNGRREKQSTELGWGEKENKENKGEECGGRVGSERNRTEWYNTNRKRNRDSRRIRNVLI